MKNLNELKNKIEMLNNVAKLSKATEMIAMTRILKIKKIVKNFLFYKDKIRYILQKNNYINCCKYTPNKIHRKLVYIILPDTGFCGNIVINMLKKIDLYLNEQDYVILFGKKCSKEIKMKYNVISSLKFGKTLPKYNCVYPMVKVAKMFFFMKKISKVTLIYTKFSNITIQKAYIEEILPIKNNKTNKYFLQQKETLDDLIQYYLEIEMYNSLINAYISEQAARAISMYNTKTHALEVSKKLYKIYNKSRQEKITDEILDFTNWKLNNN
ncbi:MAG: F0F1 ATP synthase subunit gamma [Endomicrobium sp.]|jgi:F-type H+-transporting ATPase subunit gamma|nr:F0F1 ATP synthase subunit gamma [Endomicrobium sp.]